MFDFISKLISPVTNIVDKMVMDKDKFAELQFKKTELKHEAKMKLLETTTTPTIDAIVKILVALKDVIIPLFRPLGSVLLAGFGAYCVSKGIELPEYIQVMLFGAPIGWGVSRHKNKQKGKS